MVRLLDVVSTTHQIACVCELLAAAYMWLQLMVQVTKLVLLPLCKTQLRWIMITIFLSFVVATVSFLV
jgi:hypothetical protein